MKDNYVKEQYVSKNAIIGYFDLLGFSNYVKNNPDNADMVYKCINSALLNFDNFISPQDGTNSSSIITKENLSLNMASDSIVFCLDIDTIMKAENITEETVIWRYLSLTSYLFQQIFSFTKLLMRGSIQIGDVYIKKLSSFDNNIFMYSQTHCDNVFIEQNIAHTPRIIVSSKIANKLINNQQINIYFNESVYSQLMKDSDGLFFISNYWWDINNSNDLLFIKNNKIIIKENLKNNTNKIKEYSYWNWFKNYHNTVITRKILVDKKNSDLLEMYKIE